MRYRIIERLPGQWYVEQHYKFLGIIDLWTIVRPGFFIEAEAQEFLDALLKSHYPRVVREVILED